MDLSALRDSHTGMYARPRPDIHASLFSHEKNTHTEPNQKRGVSTLCLFATISAQADATT